LLEALPWRMLSETGLKTRQGRSFGLSVRVW